MKKERTKKEKSNDALYILIRVWIGKIEKNRSLNFNLREERKRTANTNLSRKGLL